MVRRLLQRLEQRVLGMEVHERQRVDDGDLLHPREAAQHQLSLQLPHLLDGDVPLALALLQPMHVRMVPVANAQAARALAAGVTRAGLALNGGGQGGGHGSLSRALGAHEKIGVVKPVAVHGSPQ